MVPLVADDAPALPADGAGRLGDPDLAAVDLEGAGLEARDLALLVDRAAELAPALGRRIEPMALLGQKRQQVLRVRVAVDARHRRIGGDQAAVRCALVDALDGVLEDGAVLGVGVASALLGALALGEIEEDADRGGLALEGAVVAVDLDGEERAVLAAGAEGAADVPARPRGLVGDVLQDERALALADQLGDGEDGELLHGVAEHLDKARVRPDDAAVRHRRDAREGLQRQPVEDLACGVHSGGAGISREGRGGCG